MTDEQAALIAAAAIVGPNEAKNDTHDSTRAIDHTLRVQQLLLAEMRKRAAAKAAKPIGGPG